jgi:hypothetical protein
MKTALNRISNVAIMLLALVFLAGIINPSMAGESKHQQKKHESSQAAVNNSEANAPLPQVDESPINPDSMKKGHSKEQSQSKDQGNEKHNRNRRSE